jgi:hypothetical protein
MVEKILGTGIIRPNNNPFVSPMVLVKKKDFVWRLCVDYKALNKLTIKDKYHIPMVEELLEELTTIFSKINLISRYHHIRMVSRKEFKTVSKHTMTTMSSWSCHLG